jgi:hypothetical protein
VPILKDRGPRDLYQPSSQDHAGPPDPEPALRMQTTGVNLLIMRTQEEDRQLCLFRCPSALALRYLENWHPGMGLR